MKLLVRLRRLAVAFQPGEKSEKEDRREADAQPSQKENYQLAGNSPNLAEAQQAKRRIIRDGNRVGDVISRMRALFKKAPAAKEPVDINLVIQDVLTLSQPELQKDRVSLRTQFAVEDKIQLQQVILNLVVNAIEAMSGVTENQRELHVSSQKITESHSESVQETIEAKAPSEPGSTSLLIAVRDAGPGLDPTELKHVFETLYTTKSHGMGMGLAISRSIIEAHNGRLWVTANAPRGAVFQFTLPCIPVRSELDHAATS